MDDGKLIQNQMSPSGGAKKAYKTPKLEVYGSAAELTKGVGGSAIDPGHGGTATKKGMG